METSVNNKCKAFTSLEQSKKLAEILPLESADMHYHYGNDFDELESIPTITEEDDHFTLFPNDVRCWSLAALLGVFPPYLFEFERGIDFNVYPNLNGKGWHCSYMPNCIENMKKDKFRLITSEDSLVDACVAMIEKLNELNLL